LERDNKKLATTHIKLKYQNNKIKKYLWQMESEGKVQLLAFLNTAMKLCAPKEQIMNFMLKCVIINLLRRPYTMKLAFRR
jgi:hypothetical protein